MGQTDLTQNCFGKNIGRKNIFGEIGQIFVQKATTEIPKFSSFFSPNVNEGRSKFQKIIKKIFNRGISPLQSTQNNFRPNYDPQTAKN